MLFNFLRPGLFISREFDVLLCQSVSVNLLLFLIMSSGKHVIILRLLIVKFSVNFLETVFEETASSISFCIIRSLQTFTSHSCVFDPSLISILKCRFNVFFDCYSTFQICNRYTGVETATTARRTRLGYCPMEFHRHNLSIIISPKYYSF